MAHWRILVVDDEESLLLLLRRFLEGRGYHVETYASAASALAALDRSQPFDLAIADLALPGVSGNELLETMLSKSAVMRVLVCSGYPFDVEVIAPEERRRVMSLQKPFLPNMLEQAIHRLMSAR